MTDFVERVLRPEANNYPVRNTMDMDFSERPMLQFAKKHFADVTVAMELIDQKTKIPVVAAVDVACCLCHCHFRRAEVLCVPSTKEL